MSKKTLGMVFRELRGKNGMTMLEVGNIFDAHESTISKIERDKPVRWETVHMALTAGLSIKASSAEYAEFHRLWLVQRATIAESHGLTHGAKTLSKHGIEATRRFRNLIHGLNPAQTKRVLDGASRAAGKLSKPDP